MRLMKFRILSTFGAALLYAGGVAQPIFANSDSCAKLMSALQQVNCHKVHSDFPSFAIALEEILSRSSDDDIRRVLESLEFGRLAGEKMAVLGLATIYENGLGGVPLDVSRATNYYLDAVILGSIEAKMLVAMIYCDGRIPAPVLECLYFLRDAAESGHTQALLVLAEQLVEKLGDFKGAEVYLKKGIEFGMPGAEEALRKLLASRT